LWAAKDGRDRPGEAPGAARSGCWKRRSHSPRPQRSLRSDGCRIHRGGRRGAALSLDAPAKGRPSKERIASRLERIEAAYGRRIGRATGRAGDDRATAPFVGLFGHRVGLMNSFIGISKSHTTNLAVVAPGIAQALLATAFGLAAADPGGGDLQRFRPLHVELPGAARRYTAAVLRLVSRDLDRRARASNSRRRPNDARDRRGETIA